MNAILEAMVGTTLFIIFIALVTSHVQDIFLANAQEALYESLKQRGYTIASIIKLWLENQQNSIDEIKNEINGMSNEEFQNAFISTNLKINEKEVEVIIYYVKISFIAEISKGSYYNIIENPFSPIEKGYSKIPSNAIKVIDIAKVKNTLCLIEVYLWVGREKQELKQG